MWFSKLGRYFWTTLYKTTKDVNDTSSKTYIRRNKGVLPSYVYSEHRTSSKNPAQFQESSRKLVLTVYTLNKQQITQYLLSLLT